ncbi:MAG: hypothetical protein P4L41_10460 [Flavipsychrobacter sp.]|nr:hypothetical protein [Flavipsychrobacter sp.]
MKTKIISAALLLGVLSFASCKKDYTCTCTTVVGTASTTETHSISNATHNDAKNTCDNYQTQANNALPGGTTCHL